MYNSAANDRLIMDHARDIILLTEMNGTIVAANKRAIDTYGYSYEEIVKMNIRDLRDWPGLQISIEAMIRAVPGGMFFQTRHKRKDGSSFPVEVSAKWVASGHQERIISIIRDISPREKTREALIQSETRWQLAVQGSNDVIWDWNLNSGEIFISDRLADFTGYAPEEIPVHIEDFRELCHPDDIDLISQALFDHFRKKAPIYSAEYRIKNKDGTYRWVLARGQALWTEAGRAIRVVGSAMDIDERRRMEDQLRGEQNKMQVLLTQAPYGLAVMDHQGRIQQVNPMFTHVTGYVQDDVPTLEAFNKRAFPRRQDLLQAALTWPQLVSNPFKSNVLKTLCKDGQFRYLEFRASVLDDGTVMVAMADVTAARMAAEELRRSEAKYRAVVENSYDAICIYQNERFTFFNSKTMEITGFSREELKQMSIWDFFHPEDLDKAQQESRKRLAGESSRQPYVARIYSQDGSMKFLEFIGTKLGINKEPTILISARDVTERVQMEESLIQSEKQMRTLFANMLDGFSYHRIISNDEGKPIDFEFVELNDAFEEIMGLKRHEVLGRRFTEILPGIENDSTDWIGLFGQMALVGSRLKFEAYSRYLGKWLSIAAFSIEKGYFATVFFDITEHKKAEEEKLYLSNYDSLTGVYNRRYFEKELRKMDRAQYYPLSIIVGDVNGLKLVNDAFGHQQGDVLLVTIARLFEEVCGADTVIARCGGDEFAVLLPGTDEKAALEYCKHIKEKCKAYASEPIQPSIALGTATKHYSDIDVDHILSDAEGKMYRNKLLDSKSVRSAIISSLEATLHERTMETKDHAKRMHHLSVGFGRYLNLPDFEIGRLTILSRLHDIGKIAIPDDILMKPGPLSKEEMGIIQTHPEIGFRIAHTSYELSFIAEEILCHHERWDGNGYPKGLQGDEIPLLSQILAIVDAYDVMTHDRVYKKAISQEEALEEISRHAGTQFNPSLARAFIEWMQLPGQNPHQPSHQ